MTGETGIRKEMIKIYAVGINNLGKLGDVVPCGNNGLQKLRNKTLRGWLSETTTMRRVVDRVYVITDFTQKMCEMGPHELAEYVIMNGKRIK